MTVSATTAAATRPAALPEDTASGPGLLVPQVPGGVAGWLLTGDHKRIGRLYIGTALVFLLASSVVGAIVGAERVDSGSQVLDADAFTQVYTSHAASAVLLFLLPVFIGIATAVVPLQLGAVNIAFPRLSALSYWGYLVSGAIMISGYAADGGPGGSDANAIGLWLLGVGGLAIAAVLGLLSIVTTILVLRAPGMTLGRTPPFSWSMLVSGGLILLSAPVLVANVMVQFLGFQHAGFDPPDWDAVAWFFRLPQVYLLVLPAVGVAAEVLPVMFRTRQPRHRSILGVIGAIGVLGYGAWAQVQETFDDPLYVAFGVAAVVPALAFLALLADTARRGRPVLDAPLAFSLGIAVMLFLGALAGGAAVIDPLDLDGTTWMTGQAHLVLFGVGVLGALGALVWWAPKLWGVQLGPLAGWGAFALVFGGTLALAVPDLVSGLVENQPLASTEFDDTTLTVAMNVVALVGAVLAILGVLVFVADLLRSAGSGATTDDDPWGGHTLEWATASPPVPGNFPATIPAVVSAAPLLDAREQAGGTSEVPG